MAVSEGFSTSREVYGVLNFVGFPDVSRRFDRFRGALRGFRGITQFIVSLRGFYEGFKGVTRYL